MDTLRPRNDFLPSDEHIKGIAVLALGRRRHRIKRSNLHQCQTLMRTTYKAEERKM